MATCCAAYSYHCGIVSYVDLSGYCEHDNVIIRVLILRLILYRYVISVDFRSVP